MGEAAALFEQAAAADPSEPRAQFGLGRARLATDDTAGALAAFTRARDLGVDFADLHFGIGSAHAARGDMALAAAAFAEAARREPDHPGAQHGLLACLEAMPVGVDAAILESVLAPLLAGHVVNPRALGHACARLLARKHGLEADADPERSPGAAEALLGDPVARRYLARTVNVSAPVERLLTALRAEWLSRVSDANPLSPSTVEGAAAMAIQCFLNEHVWSVTAEETRAVEALESRMAAALSSAAAPDDDLVARLLVYACYRPLVHMPGADRLAAVADHAWPEPVRDVLRVCLQEPLRERALAAAIPTAGAIDDDVSHAVRAQYEENPYPRWMAVTRRFPQSLEDRVRRACPHLESAVADAPRVLVAGCGTGMDAIEIALHVSGADVTAMDLSRASLAYAARKAEEHGLGNIRFRQQDILALDAGDGPYDLINCMGVLHHMREVGAGLARLVPLLAPGGLMKLALYSRIARAPLMAAREDIRAAGFGPGLDDIRRFRRRVLEAGAGGPHAELMGSTDFYSTSECRDLLFHVQELELDLPEIRRLLEGAGLAFLGFEIAIPEVADGFRREHPAAAATDLDAWHAYERRHPEIFRGMYVFWCRRLDA